MASPTMMGCALELWAQPTLPSVHCFHQAFQPSNNVTNTVTRGSLGSLFSLSVGSCRLGSRPVARSCPGLPSPLCFMHFKHGCSLWLSGWSPSLHLLHLASTQGFSHFPLMLTSLTPSSLPQLDLHIQLVCYPSVLCSLMGTLKTIYLKPDSCSSLPNLCLL